MQWNMKEIKLRALSNFKTSLDMSYFVYVTYLGVVVTKRASLLLCYSKHRDVYSFGWHGEGGRMSFQFLQWVDRKRKDLKGK